MSSKMKIWLMTLAVILLAGATFWACRRQMTINDATRQWENAGGGIIDTEIPLFGPAEVFLAFDTIPERQNIEALKVATRKLYECCSPSIEFRWKDPDGRLSAVSAEQLSILAEILSETGVSKVVLLRARLSAKDIIDFLAETQSVKRLVLPKTGISQDDINALSKLRVGEVLHFR